MVRSDTCELRRRDATLQMTLGDELIESDVLRDAQKSTDSETSVG